MAQQRGPAGGRRSLGAELRRLRIAAGLKGEEVAQHLKCSATRISRIESGHQGAVAKAEDVRTMCQLYGVTDERQVEMLLDMLRSSQQIGWWEAYEDVLPSGLEVLVGLEVDAQAKRSWEPLIMHGLLQTSDYARAVLVGWESHAPSDIDALVEVRDKRKDVITRSENPMELWAVLDENTIRRPVATPEVMRKQLAHLLELAERPNVHIQVLPWAKGAHPGLGGSFSILEFEEDSPIVYVESLAGNLHLDKRPVIRRFTSMFQLLTAMALPLDESTVLLRKAAKELQ